MVPERMKRRYARPEVQCAGLMRPAQQVGGDFYDAFYVEPERLAVVIGAVCGKGMPAALFMSRTLTLLRSEGMKRRAAPSATTWSSIERANRHLCRANDAGYFASVFVAHPGRFHGAADMGQCRAPRADAGAGQQRVPAHDRSPRRAAGRQSRRQPTSWVRRGCLRGPRCSSTPTASPRRRKARGEMFGDRRAARSAERVAARVDAAGHDEDRGGSGRKLWPRDGRRRDDITLLALRYLGPR